MRSDENDSISRQFEKLINASDLIEWIMETYPDWCVGAVRSIVDHVEALPTVDAAPINIDGDGTLMVTVGENSNISRVIVLYGDSIFCGVFYPDGEKDGDEHEAD